MKTIPALVLAIMCALAPSHAIAQTPPATSLLVTVVDQTGAVIVGAAVAVTAATPNATQTPPTRTSDAGVAVIAGLAPGVYTIEAAFAGFETRVLKDVRLRAGENRQVAVLTIQRVETAVTVEQDKQLAASDRNGPTFGTVLTRDQIEELSDDPQTLQQQLQDIAGPGAVIRIDGFEGGALPPKAMIRSIRIARDQFAAEYHNAGGVSIEIITQPGVGPVRYFSTMNLRDGALSGRSPFVPVKGPEMNANYGFGMTGSLIKDKSSFSLGMFGVNSYDTPNLNAVRSTGSTARALSQKRVGDTAIVNGQVDYALSLDQTLRFGYNFTRFANGNLGTGGYDEPERAYSTETVGHTLRAQHFGPVGRRAFSRSRLQFLWTDVDASSALQAPTMRVLDAFTSGGAQRAGGDHARTLNLGSDLDYVLGRHSLRMGVALDSIWYHSDSTTNYLGTYTFDNLQAYPNQPSNYTRRIGDPNISYSLVQGAVYVQDDIRVRRSLTITPGVRYEIQSHVGDYTNIGPRFGLTWAPFPRGQTTIRASAGVFYDWLSMSTFDQSVRVDGFHQQEINIINPALPVSLGTATVAPANRYLFGSAYNDPRMTRVSAGIDQVLPKATRVGVTYSYVMGSRLARGENLNAPVNGVRPDPRFANVVDAVSDASSRQHQVQVDTTVNPGALLPAYRGPKFSWKRTTVFANYTLNFVKNNTDGAFAVPATGNLEGEWGSAVNSLGPANGFVFNGFVLGGAPIAPNDVRHRLNLQFNNQVIRNVLVGFGVNASTAPPYDYTTGRDDNGDGIFNDRPAGVGRNTLRARGQATAFLSLGYLFAFGRNAAPLPPVVGVFGNGAAAEVRTIDQGPARYILQLRVNISNLTNERNYQGFSGVATSPFFGQPTSVNGMRKVDVGAILNF